MALKEVKLPRGLKLEEVIFVNDGSTDSTKARIQNAKIKFDKKFKIKVKLISYKKNMGKGYAVKQGMLKSNSDYTLFFDADISTPLLEITKFYKEIKKGTDVIIGTRKNGKSTVVNHQPFFREILGRGFTKLSQVILGSKTTDFTCGFKAFSQKGKEEIFIKTKIYGWGFDAETIFLAEKLGFKTKEIPVTWSDDKQTKVKLYKAIPQTLFELLKILWAHKASNLIFNPFQTIIARFA